MELELKIALDRIEELYNRMKACSSTTGKRNNGEQILCIMHDCPAVKTYWYYKSNEACWVNKFGKYAVPNTQMESVTVRQHIVYDTTTTERHAPNTCGLYFIGNVTCNPHTLEPQYWVKIGRSKQTIRDRLKTYDTYSPSIYHIDYKITRAMEQENSYRDILRLISFGRSERNNEWFLVDRETYLAMSEYGFKYFEKI